MPTLLETAHRRVSRGTQTDVDLARIVAIEHKGWKAHPGGYIKDANGKTIAQGWLDIASLFSRRGIIRRTANGIPCINWMRLNPGTRIQADSSDTQHKQG